MIRARTICRGLWLPAGLLTPAGCTVHERTLGETIDQMACPPAGFGVAVKPSKDYAGLSNDALAAQAHSDFWGRWDYAAARALAERYECGEGTARDLDKAVAWYRSATIVLPQSSAIYVPGVGGRGGSVMSVATGSVTAGDPIALHRLGEMLRDGVGLPPDPAHGLWLIDCAEIRGFSNAP